jgi:hypothetical protein
MLHTNTVSRILGLMIRELPALWHEPFGYAPLPAGTFSDIQASEGTCCSSSSTSSRRTPRFLASLKTRSLSPHRYTP